ncbi:membrane protein [Mycobacterium tuberculosis 2092HD]|uniref:PH domain-containing protein n=1 Tax=Mycobacterium tuberculosis TaxID=1773 RepID=UPI00045B6427|nr:PH domain-containing protein [Mycobacterium tuberculosis]KAN04896.1 membrane protein [Mycobacterium tuberculosis 2230BH]KEA69158.1 membrane protein [Mycobacterium tuberculosis 2104HD]KEA95708.1 membrane protein [Mycobacterium tuberculosis 2542MS]KEA99417.1 membrane protein [Mycobacterium tuberculosis 2092HD]KEB03789.1 membrane protein [Mycobacterium tuberculosis 2995AB]
MQQTARAPRTSGIAGCGAGGVVMAIASVTLVTDTPGRVLTGVAALGLILFASATWRARPRLAITPDGLAIRGWFRTQLLRHSNIKIIRIDEFRRYGRLVRLLEIETVSGGLLILSRWDLGTDPVEVLDALTAAGYAGRGQR